jgi:hypothetical protein
MKQILNSENESYFVAFAMGYADGKGKGVDDGETNFNTPEEKYLYEAGYERGVSDFCYIMDYGMFED